MYQIADGKPCIWTICDNCGEIYNDTCYGGKYYYNSTKTKLVDINNVKMATTIYNEYGESANTNRVYIRSWSNEPNFTVTEQFIGTDKLIVKASLKIPDELLNHVSESFLASSSNINCNLYSDKLSKGHENGQLKISPSKQVYDKETKTIDCEYNITLKDYTQNCIFIPNINIVVIVTVPTGSYDTLYRYGYIKDILIDFNEPSITSAGY